MWFKKQDSSKALKHIADLMTIVEKRLSTLEIEVDSLRIRMRKKLLAPQEAPEVKPEGIQDGFDELRKLNKES